ncbi:hypothetical protein C3747_93g56 [Trypanosoma cruzi]|uniref:MGT2 magnesium transporter n=1 Tax=Trypanosoma cruzi TaxID=5693 RepID=A0A2V2WHR8_TRYCR|nr:hypothetical protein ECC02_004988 [Trypanosoma cruzi]KAF8292019.1 putative CorA-like Mg2+ transporter protein [Trypanosoma cruzi]PWV08156.1 hypothetical protein C3747_93g56 [Trypanosoma cruzi]
MQLSNVDFTPVKGVVQGMQRCTIARQFKGEATIIQNFRLPDEVLLSLRKMLSTQEQDCMWVDMQGCTDEQNRNVLRLLFPDLQQSQIEGVLSPEKYDAVELQPVKGEYLIGSLACACRRQRCALEMEDEENTVICSFVCNDRFLVTMHAAPFLGLKELLHHVKVGGGLLIQETTSEFCDSEGTDIFTMKGSAVLCALVCFTCETYLPNLTGLISEVDCIDEMVLLVAPGKRDQTDLLRRVSVLRRRMSTENARLYLKEKLLQELMGPTMRTTFVSRDSELVKAYREVFMELSQVLERMEVARDTLNHVNLNFVNAVFMRMSQASAGFDYRMMVISQISTICLPLNLLASFYGMNCKVPWSADDYNNLNCFWVIMSIMLAWTIICMFQPVRLIFCSREADFE